MKLSVIANPEKYSIREPLTQTLSWCRSKNYDVFLTDKLFGQFSDITNASNIHVLKSEKDCVESSDFVIAIGGDGTLLHTSQIVKDHPLPILGINTGKLGFMANVQPDQVKYSLECLESNNFHIDTRYFLKANITGDSKNSYYALNELLFSRRDTTSLITITVYYDGDLLNRFWADGLIVATPTGSTAYNLSAGGPIIMPGTPLMVVTPINPHTLTTRPLVLPSDKILTIKPDTQPENILFSCDGRAVKKTFEEITITQSSLSIQLVQLPEQTYFKTLRSKLMWGQDNREENNDL